MKPSSPPTEPPAEASTGDPPREGAPRAATDLGLSDRYRYLVGRSGRRYLFSAVPAEELGAYRAAVVLLDATAGHAAWMGEVDRDGMRRGAPLSARALAGRRAWIHLLARSAADRRAVMDDLLANDAAPGGPPGGLAGPAPGDLAPATLPGLLDGSGTPVSSGDPERKRSG